MKPTLQDHIIYQLEKVSPMPCVHSSLVRACTRYGLSKDIQDVLLDMELEGTIIKTIDDGQILDGKKRKLTRLYSLPEYHVYTLIITKGRRREASY